MVRQTGEAWSGSPTWLKAAVQLGVPALIALGLTWIFATDVRSDVRAMRGEHQTLTFYLRALCFNTAQTDSQRAACVPPEQVR